MPCSRCSNPSKQDQTECSPAHTHAESAEQVRDKGIAGCVFRRSRSDLSDALCRNNMESSGLPRLMLYGGRSASGSEEAGGQGQLWKESQPRETFVRMGLK